MTSKFPPWIDAPRRRLKVEPITPTDEKRRNGWDEESLSQYVAERRAAQAMLLDPAARRPARPQQANGPRWNFPARRSWTVKPSWQR